jgi:hypothetical protein
MSFASLRDRLRAAAVLALGLGATAGYAVFLNASYPVRDWLFWKIGAMWLWGLFLSAGCVSAGHLVLSRALRVTDLPTLETVVTSAALGLLLFVTGMYLGGFARLYNPVFAFLLPLSMLAAGAGPLVAFIRARRAAWASAPPRERDPWKSAAAALATGFGVFSAAFVYLEVMTPEAINFDASWSHFPIAVDYARAGRIIPFDADYTRCFPHLASVVYTWAFIVPAGPIGDEPLRWMMAQHLEFFFFLWTLAGVAAMTRWLLDDERVRGAWAAFFLCPAIFVYDNNLGGAADHILAFFGPPLFLAAVRSAPRFDARRTALVGAFAAGALHTKYQGLYLILGVGAVLGGSWIAAAIRAFRARRAPTSADPPLSSWRELAWAPLAVIAAFFFFMAPHFLKNGVFYHNPVYPFAQDVFPSRPTTPNAAYLFEWLFKDYKWRPHGTFLENVRDAVRLCFSYSFEPHYTFTKGVPNAGSLFTLCLPMALLVRSPRRLWLGFAAGMGALFAWGMIFRVDRHLQTFMPLVMATTGAVLVRAWDLGWIARAGLIPLCALQVIWGGDAAFYAGHSRLSSAIELLRSGYEGRAATRFSGYRANYRAIGAALPKDARVILHMYRPNLGVSRDILLDWAGQQGLILYEDIHGPRSLYDLWRSLGVTHLLWLPGRRAASTKQEEVLFTDFVQRYGKDRRHIGGEELVTLPSEPPPPDHPFQVLSIGLAGYADGLYPVEAMKTYEAVPENKETFAPPAKPLPQDVAAQLDLVNGVDAVLLADHAKIDAALKGRIDARFVPGQTFSKSFTVYVRRAGPN